MPVLAGGVVNCTDTDDDGETVPSVNDVCIGTCDSGLDPTVAVVTCQTNGTFNDNLECPAGLYLLLLLLKQFIDSVLMSKNEILVLHIFCNPFFTQQSSF